MGHHSKIGYNFMVDWDDYFKDIFSHQLHFTYMVSGCYANIRPISQIPQCTGFISHNAPFCNKNVHMYAHFCYKMVHCGIFVWCIVGFVRWGYSFKYNFNISILLNSLKNYKLESKEKISVWCESKYNDFFFQEFAFEYAYHQQTVDHFNQVSMY